MSRYSCFQAYRADLTKNEGDKYLGSWDTEKKVVLILTPPYSHSLAPVVWKTPTLCSSCAWYKVHNNLHSPFRKMLIYIGMM